MSGEQGNQFRLDTEMLIGGTGTEQARENRKTWRQRFREFLGVRPDSVGSTLDPLQGEAILDSVWQRYSSHSLQREEITANGLEFWQGKDPTSQQDWKLLVHATPLNSGGMSTVHMGLDLNTGEKVALKVPNREAYYRAEEIPPTGLADKTVSLAGKPTNQHITKLYLEANQREQEAIRRSDSPYVIKAHGSFLRQQANQQELVLVLQYLSPKDYLNGSQAIDYYRGKERDAWDDFTSWVPHLSAAALDAHQYGGIIHLDIKPSNIWIPRREGNAYHALLADFGVVATKNRPDLTIEAGSRPFRPPELYGLNTEQLLQHFHEYPESALVYSLAGTIACILGFGFLQRPDLSEGAIQAFCQRANENSQTDKLDAKHLLLVLQKATSHNPNDRYQTLDEFTADFLRTSAMHRQQLNS